MRTNIARALLLAVDRHATPLAEASAGQVRGQSFSVYGNRAAAPGVLGALGFNGEYLERTGLYLPGGYRAYSPALRRFCQADNLSPFGAGGLNAYAWCLGDPVNLVDPDGHNPLVVLIAGTLVLGTGLLVGASFVEDEKTRNIMFAVGGFAVGVAVAGVAHWGRMRVHQRRQLRSRREAQPAMDPQSQAFRESQVTLIAGLVRDHDQILRLQTRLDAANAQLRHLRMSGATDVPPSYRSLNRSPQSSRTGAPTSSRADGPTPPLSRALSQVDISLSERRAFSSGRRSGAPSPESARSGIRQNSH